MPLQVVEASRGPSPLVRHGSLQRSVRQGPYDAADGSPRFVVLIPAPILALGPAGPGFPRKVLDHFDLDTTVLIVVVAAVGELRNHPALERLEQGGRDDKQEREGPVQELAAQEGRMGQKRHQRNSVRRRRQPIGSIVA